jgi:hypothetical protein
MRRKAGVAIAVFALAFSAAGGVSIAEDNGAGVDDGIMAVTGINHMAVQGTAWVPERPKNFDLFKHWAWGTRTRAKKATQEWVHIAIPTPTYIDGTQLKVNFVQFCAKAWKPLKSAPVAVHIWANNVRVHAETITWPNSTAVECHDVSFSPAVWMESVGVSVLVKYANAKNKVELNKAWIQLVP